ncbi:hypothetical protein LXL04_022471 [Taraxacum kok-saghyz]
MEDPILNLIGGCLYVIYGFAKSISELRFFNLRCVERRRAATCNTKLEKQFVQVFEVICFHFKTIKVEPWICQSDYDATSPLHTFTLFVLIFCSWLRLCSSRTCFDTDIFKGWLFGFNICFVLCVITYTLEFINILNWMDFQLGLSITLSIPCNFLV